MTTQLNIDIAVDETVLGWLDEQAREAGVSRAELIPSMLQDLYKLHRLRQALKEGDADIAAGRTLEGKEAMRAIRERVEARLKDTQGV